RGELVNLDLTNQDELKSILGDLNLQFNGDIDAAAIIQNVFTLFVHETTEEIAGKDAAKVLDESLLAAQGRAPPALVTATTIENINEVLNNLSLPPTQAAAQLNLAILN